MPGKYEKFLADAVRAGYDVPAVEAEIKRSIPQLFLLAKQKKLPESLLAGRLTEYGLPSHLWTDPATVRPEIDQSLVASGAPEEFAPRGLPPAPEGYGAGRRGPADPQMTQVFQTLAKLLTIPGRGTRGLAVGAVNAPQGLGAVSERAAAAVQPGFQPQGTAEEVASVVGQTAGDLALGAAVAGPVGLGARAAIGAGERAFGVAAPRLLAGLATAGAEGAAVGGTFQALNEMAAKGHVSADDVAQAAKLGAGLGVGIKGGAEAAQALWGRLAPAVAVRIQYELNVLKRIISKGTGIPLGETGLVPYDFKKAVAEGRMTLADAARQSERVFQEQLGIRSKGEVPENIGSTAARPLKMAPGVVQEPQVPGAIPAVPEAPRPVSGPAKARKTPKAKAPVTQAPETPPTPGPQTVVPPSPLAPVAAGPLDAPKTPPPELAPPPPTEPVTVRPAGKGGKLIPQIPAPAGSTPLGISPVPAKQVDLSKAQTGVPFTATMYQGRGATPEQVYGKENVELGRAYPFAGKGEYFATKHNEAEEYGKVSSVQVELKNPYVLDNDQDFYRLLNEAKALHLSSVHEEYHKDPKGVPAAAERFQALLKAKGHDGLVVRLTSRAFGDQTRRMGESFSHSQVVKFGAATPAAVAPAAPAPPAEATPPLAPFQPLEPMTVDVIAKARKAVAIETVEKALKVAKPEAEMPGRAEPQANPVSGRLPGKPEKRGTAKIIEIEIDGGIKVRNTKEALTDLLARLKQLPEKATLGRQKYPLQKLIYTAARQERFGPMIEVTGGRWFTDGKAAIKGPAPSRVKKSDRSPVAQEGLDTLINAAAAKVKPAKLLYYSVNGSTEGVSPVPIDNRLAQDHQPPLAVFETPLGYMAFDQNYVTAVVNRYPDASWHADESGQILVAKVGEEPVAMVKTWGNRSVIDAGPPNASEAQLVGLYEPRAQPPQILADQIEIPSQPSEAAGDLLTGQEQNLPPSEPRVETPDDRRRAFATFMLTKVDNVRAREIMQDLHAKLGNVETLTFKEKQGLLKGSYDPSTGELMLGDRDNIATLIHETGHAIDHAMGTRFKQKDTPFGLAAKVDAGQDAAIEKILREELKRVAQYVRPYYPKAGDFGKDKHWTTYRGSHPELFADWWTIFAVDQNIARNLAPTFTNLWLKRLEAFPKVKAAVEPLLGQESPLLRASLADRKPADIGRFVLDWVKGPELDESVKDLHRGWADLGKEKLDRLYNLIGLPFWKGQADPRMGQIFNALHGVVYRTARLENIGLELAKFDDLAKLPAESLGRVSRTIYFGNDEPIQRYFSSKELAVYPHHLTPKEIQAYQDVVRAVRFGTSMLVQLYKKKIGFDALPEAAKEDVEKEIRESIERLGGYFPIMRFGDHLVYGIASDEKTMWYGFEKSRVDAAKTANELAKAGYSGVQIADRKRLPPEFWMAARGKLSGFEIEMLVEAAGADRADPNIQAVLAQAQKYRFKDMINRKWIPGFKKTGDNMLESLQAYMSSMSGRLAKFEGTTTARRVIEGKINPNREPILYQDAMRYLNNFGDMSSDELYWFRRAFYSWNLAFKPAFFLQNLTQPLVTTWNEIARFKGGIEPEGMMLRSYAKTFNVLANSLGAEGYDTSSLTPLAGYLVRRAEKEGLISGQFTQEMLQERLPGRHKLEKVLGFLGHSSEQVNRMHALLSAAEIAEDRELTKEEAYEFSRDFIHRTQFPFGEANQPPWVTQAGRFKSLAKLLSMFRSYWMNMLHRLARQVGPEFEPAVLARSMAGLLGLAGISGVPFEGLLRWAVWKFTDHDIDPDIRSALGKHDKVADFILGGLPALADIDTRRMLGLGDIYQAPRVGSGFMESAAEFAGGAIGGSAMRSVKALDLLHRGEGGRAFEQVAPAFLAYIKKADRISKEGLRYAGGELLIPAKDIKAYQIVYTAMGLTPMTFSRKYDERDAEAKVRDAIKSDKRKYLESMAKAIQKRDMPELRRLQGEIEKHNVSARKAGAPERLILISSQSVRRRLWEMRTESVGVRLKSAPRQARRKIAELDAMYGQ